MPSAGLDLIRPEPFFNRKAELRALDACRRYHPKGAMAMVYGRRRLGKTYLLQRFFTEPNSDPTRVIYYLASQSTAEVQRRELADRLIATLPESMVTLDELAVSWNSLLRYASRRTREIGPNAGVALVLDEFPYLVDESPELPSVLQAWWDAEGAHSPICLILCGSQLSAMSALSDGVAPLHGRFNAGRHLIRPMRYDGVGEFYEVGPLYGTTEKLLMYGALGGTPRYHAMVQSNRAWDDQIINLLFRPGCPLEDEVRFLLSSEQIRDVATYQAVLGGIASGRSKRREISGATGISENALSHTLNVLIELGWVAKERPFGEKSDSRALYRVADPFVSFHYRFVARHASALQFSDATTVFQTYVAPHLPDYMGRYVFETVCAQWLQKRAVRDLGLTPTDMGRWWSRDRQLEIDIVAPLEGGSTLFAECKWGPVDLDDLVRLKAKVARLPERSWQQNPKFVLFTSDRVADRLRWFADSDPAVMLVDGSMLF